MHELRARRKQLKISQTALAQRSGVSRFKICLYELGDGTLTDDELARIEQALQAEAQHMRGVLATLERQNRTADETEADCRGCEVRP